MEVVTIDDLLFEETETFQAHLTLLQGSVGITIEDGTATASIEDNDGERVRGSKGRKTVAVLNKHTVVVKFLACISFIINSPLAIAQIF